MFTAVKPHPTPPTLVLLFSLLLLFSFSSHFLTSSPPLPYPSNLPPKFCQLSSNPCIFDIGHNNGQDTKTYLQDPTTRVVAVEANPTLIYASRRKFAEQLKEGRLLLVKVGLAREQNGTLVFWVNANDKFSSFQEALGCRDGYGRYVSRGNHTFCKKVTIGITTCARLIQAFGRPDYIKIDIEGLDRVCVESFRSLPKNLLPRYVSVENVNESMLKLLVHLGYAGFKAVNQATLQVGTDGDTRGRSGPWGEDSWDDQSGTQWMTQSAFEKRLPLNENVQLAGQTVHAWYDLHARLDAPTWL